MDAGDRSSLARQNGAMARNPSLRASDAEREEVAAVLRDNLAEGRLTLEEFNERLDGVYASKTYGQLDALLVDLPRKPGTGPMTFSDAGAQIADRWDSYRLGRFRRRWSRYLQVNCVLWAIWGVSVASSHAHNLEGFWPIWVSLPWGAILLRRPWFNHYQRHSC